MIDWLLPLFHNLPLAQFEGRSLTSVAVIVLVLFLGVGIHEYCHAKFADMAGDPTPGIYGRVTLNLFKHFDPIGGIMMIFMAWSGFGFGWGKPVPMDPRKMRNPRQDFLIAVAAGPVSNLLQAVVYGFILRVGIAMGVVGENPLIAFFLLEGVIINLVLFFFNLIPLGPLDGSRIVGTLLPGRLADQWTLFQNRYGTMIFIVLLIVGFVGPHSPLGSILQPLVERGAILILGR